MAAAPKQETSSELAQPTSVNGEAKEAPPPPPPPPKQLQLSIAYLRWDEFDKIGISGKYVIDALIGDVCLYSSFDLSYVYRPKS